MADGEAAGAGEGKGAAGEGKGGAGDGKGGAGDGKGAAGEGKGAAGRAKGVVRRATLRDVAAAAGVSIGSASNAFNRPELLSEGTRERVLGEARRLGYAGPDPAARRLRTGRTGALGLLFTYRLPGAFEDESAVIFLRGVARELEASASGLLLIPTSADREEGAQVVRAAAVDGFIVYSTPTGDPRLLAAIERGLPTVTVDQPLDVPTPRVGIDDRAAARDAARYLIELGHERIAVVGFPEHSYDDPSLRYDITTERFAGYREGLGDLWRPELVTRGHGNRPETGSRALAELLDRGPPPTAVLAMSDAIGVGVLYAAAANGIEVPGQLSVVGFDDIPLAGRTDPPLTTIAQPTEEKGSRAARIVLDALEEGGPLEPTRTLLPTRLAVRGSTAPPPA
jgi:DNA-binding LacI/PurR family transcriptional regulator